MNTPAPFILCNVPVYAYHSGRRCCSVDGDADRLVYFTMPSSSSGGMVGLVDGDKIAALIASLIRDLLDGLPQEIVGGFKVRKPLHDGQRHVV